MLGPYAGATQEKRMFLSKDQGNGVDEASFMVATDQASCHGQK